MRIDYIKKRLNGSFFRYDKEKKESRCAPVLASRERAALAASLPSIPVIHCTANPSQPGSESVHARAANLPTTHAANNAAMLLALYGGLVLGYSCCRQAAAT